MENSKNFFKQSVQNKENNIKSLTKVKTHLKTITQMVFGGQPQGELGTSFQRYLDAESQQKIEKSSEWQVIGRVKIKPPGQVKEGNERVEKIYLDQFSAHKVLKALPTLPSIC